MVCWLTGDATLHPDERYTVQHTTRSARAVVDRIEYRLDVNTLHRDAAAQSLSLNEIGRIRLRAQQPLLFDPYHRNRKTGSFVLVDETTNNTVAAGMITGPSRQDSHVVWHDAAVTRHERATRGATVWLTGLPASGKSSVAVELERRLVAAGRPAYLLDGDNLRHGLNVDLGFGAADRSENVRRVGEVARMMADAGLVAVASLISPYRDDRDRVRQVHEESELPFTEVFVDTPADTCATRDPKGLYARARAGEITDFTGVDAPYEAPRTPDLVLRPEDGDPVAQAAVLFAMLES